MLFLYEGRLFSVDKNTGEVHEVLSLLPDRIGSASISRDNRELYFARVTPLEADLWLLTLEEGEE